ncbi:cyclase [bacterium]|nr:MAG: cyclase [bacterium]
MAADGRRIHDVTLAIDPDLGVWPGDPPTAIERVCDVAAGDGYTLTRLAMSAHLGTHVDAPAHFVAGGGTVDGLDLDTLIGAAVVVDLRHAGAVDAAALDAADVPPGTRRLLVRTRNSDRWARGERAFDPGFVGVTSGGAAWLVARGIRLVGIDGPSIAPFDDVDGPHLALLGAGVVVVEGLDLHAVAAGTYTLACLPLKLAGAEGAPARVVLIDGGDAF